MTAEPNVSEPTNRLAILHLIKDAQQKHGLRQGNYLRYRGYCSRRIRRLRKSLKFTNQHKSFPKRPAKFIRRPVTPEVVTELRFLEIVVFESERNWAYAMHLKLEIGDNEHDRKKFHMKQRLRRATKCSHELAKIVEKCEIVDVTTKLEAQAYDAFVRGTLCVECKSWVRAIELFDLSRKIYHKLSEVQENQNLYVSRCQEIHNLVRLCLFNCGDISEVPSGLESDSLDLDFNKLSVEHKRETEKEEPLVAKTLEPIPCKPMFFDIAMNYRKNKS